MDKWPALRQVSSKSPPNLGELVVRSRFARCMQADLLQDEFDSAAGFLAVHVQSSSALQARDRRRGVSLCGYCGIRPRRLDGPQPQLTLAALDDSRPPKDPESFLAQ